MMNYIGILTKVISKTTKNWNFFSGCHLTSMLLFQHWNLLINPVTLADSGEYECQATIHPPQSIIVKLVVQGTYRYLYRCRCCCIDIHCSHIYEMQLFDVKEYFQY